MKIKDLKLSPISLFSHELKTPLCTLKLGLDILQKSPQTEKNKELITMMEQELSRIIVFIQHQLDSNMLEDENNLLNLQWMSWDLMMKQLLKSFQLISNKKQIQIIAPATIENYEVLADSTWLFQALENLLSNAIKFSEPNSQIQIDYQVQKNHFTCSVQNQISSNKSKKDLDELLPHQDALFLKNSGLGVKIVEMIMEAHGGSLHSFIDTDKNKMTYAVSLSQVRALKKSA